MTVPLSCSTYLLVGRYLGTACSGNDGVLCVDCDSRRAVGPTKTIRGLFLTQLNRLQRLAALSAIREWSF